MANFLIIKDLLKQRKVSIRDFATELGMTEQALQLLIRKNSTKIETLELIAQKLNISITAFFEDSPSSDRTLSETDRLLSIIESQQRTIENLSKK